jgi:intracellular sulfur oxidation DsrE/DsrF family protein
MTTLQRALVPAHSKENTMNRSFSVFAGMASIALALVLSTQISSSAQIRTSDQKISATAKIAAPAKINASAKISAPAKMSTAADQKQPHRLAVQVDVNDPAVMNLALNNVSNAVQHYSELGQKVEIELVAFGPGLHMLRDDTSPVKARIKFMSEAMPNLTFAACGNTRENMTKAEAKDPYHLAGEGRQSRGRPAHGTARARLELPATLMTSQPYCPVGFLLTPHHQEPLLVLKCAFSANTI